jgi:ABC-type branched-subunit amino acid transport system substrate-binding protein
MRSKTLRRPVLATAAALALAGCGSTVQYVGQAPVQGDAQLGVPGATSPTTAGTTAGGPASSGSAVGGSVPTFGGGGGQTGPTVGTGGTGPGPAPNGTHTISGVPQGVGVTSKTISVGIWYETNGDALNAAFGATGISTGDAHADAKAVVDDINAHGGIGGRRVVPVYYALNAQSSDTYASIDQQACDRFTQDNHVFAVMGAGLTDNFLSCISRAGVIDINSGEVTAPDQTLMNQYPLYFDAGTLTTDRIFRMQVASLKQQGYFSGWNANVGGPAPASKPKIGVLSIDTPEWNRPLHSAFLPALRAAGYTVNPQDIYRVPRPSGTSQEGAVLSNIASAELRFRQDGVTHVILLDANGDLLIFFSRDAGSQHYYPRFGVSTASAPQTLEAAGDVSPTALKGTMGFSWDPGLDLTPSQGARYKPPTQDACLNMIDKRSGQNLQKLGPNAEGIAISYCDELYLLRAGVSRAGRSITNRTVQAAIQSLGFGFQSAGYLHEYYGPGRHDGVETGWNDAWSTKCNCMVYTSKAYDIPSV